MLLTIGSMVQLAALAAVPLSPEISGPNEVQPGHTVDFRIRGATAEEIATAKIVLFQEDRVTYWSVLAEWGTGLPVMIFQSFAAGDYAIVAAYYDGEQVQMLQHKFKVIGENPDPGPNPDPQPVDELFGVVIYESSDMLQQRGGKQINFGHILLSKDLHDEFDEQHLRQIDKDAQDEDGQVPDEYRPYLDAAEDKQLPHLFLVDEQGLVLYDGPLPLTVEQTVTIIRKYKR